MSSGSTSVYGGRFWVCPTSPGFFSGESWGRGPQAMPQRWGRVTHNHRPLLSCRVVTRKRETKSGAGWEVRQRRFHLCHSMVIAVLHSPRLAATWGSSCSEQDGVWEVGRHRNGGHIGAALVLSAAMESQKWAALPGSEQLL